MTSKIAEALNDAVSADPGETAGKVLGTIINSALDAVGMCGSCDLKQKADANYLGQLIIQ